MPGNRTCERSSSENWPMFPPSISTAAGFPTGPSRPSLFPTCISRGFKREDCGDRLHATPALMYTGRECRSGSPGDPSDCGRAVQKGEPMFERPSTAAATRREFEPIPGVSHRAGRIGRSRPSRPSASRRPANSSSRSIRSGGRSPLPSMGPGSVDSGDGKRQCGISAMTKKVVAIVGTLDSKGAEYAYLKQQIENQGVANADDRRRRFR